MEDVKNNKLILLSALFSHTYAHAKYIHFNLSLNRSRDSVVGIATSYGLENREVGVRVPP
jgi:hypothetical protein